MSFESLSHSQQQTRDSIGSNPSVIPIPKISKDSLVHWAGPIVVHDRDIDNSWIAGSSTNAIVGTWTGTAGGGQLVVGPTSNTESLLRVTPANGQYVNFLRDTIENVDDTTDIGLLDGTNSTGSINTSTFRIDLDNGEELRWVVAYGGFTYSRIKVTFDTDSERTNVTFDPVSGSSPTFPLTFPFSFGGGGSGIDLQASSDGGSTWEDIDNNVEHEFSTPGTDIVLRLVSNADSQYWKTTNDDGDERPIIVRLQ